MFESWTHELQLTAQLSTQVKIPTVHLDKEVMKDPRFIKDLSIEMTEKFNNMYEYQLKGKLEEISTQLAALNTNL